MDLNQKIKEQSKIVEGLITKLDNLILEQEEGTTTTPDVVTTADVSSIGDNLRKALSYASNTGIKTDDSTNIVKMNVYLKGDEIEFKGDFDGESINVGSSKGFKSMYDEKNQILTIVGKDNKIFIKNDLKDVILSFKLPKSIYELKYEFTPVETKQKSSKTGDVETLKDIVLQIANIKEVD
jgi:hypothetical protein